MMETNNGFAFEVTDEIDTAWNEYDQSVATTHLLNFDRIYIDAASKRPIDDEYELEDIHEMYESLF